MKPCFHGIFAPVHDTMNAWNHDSMKSKTTGKTMQNAPECVVVAVFNTKGGSGKTTTSVHFATASSPEIKTAILDCDPNESSDKWRKIRTAPYPIVKKASAAMLRMEIAELRKKGVQLIILDCPPSINAETTSLIAAADFIVVPVQPTILDVAGCYNATKMIRAKNKPFAYLINRQPAPSQDTRDALAALQESGEVCPVAIGDRIAFSRALGHGMAVTEFEQDKDSKALDEALKFTDWLLQRVGVKAHETHE